MNLDQNQLTDIFLKKKKNQSEDVKSLILRPFDVMACFVCVHAQDIWIYFYKMTLNYLKEIAKQLWSQPLGIVIK